MISIMHITKCYVTLCRDVVRIGGMRPSITGFQPFRCFLSFVFIWAFLSIQIQPNECNAMNVWMNKIDNMEKRENMKRGTDNEDKHTWYTQCPSIAEAWVMLNKSVKLMEMTQNFSVKRNSCLCIQYCIILNRNIFMNGNFSRFLLSFLSIYFNLQGMGEYWTGGYVFVYWPLDIFHVLDYRL